MIRELAEQVVKQVIQTYSWLAYPAAMQAQITAVSESGTVRSTECHIKDTATGETRLCRIEQPIYRYSVRITDCNGGPIDGYPSIPDVISQEAHAVGDIVTVVFVGGELHPIIVGG